jgi:hypothetical protein
MNDPINHPEHYTQGRIEVIDFIEDQRLDFHLGNAIKYICRASHKGAYEQDLHKAIWYLERALSMKSRESQIASIKTVDPRGRT